MQRYAPLHTGLNESQGWLIDFSSPTPCRSRQLTSFRPQEVHTAYGSHVVTVTVGITLTATQNLSSETFFVPENCSLLSTVLFLFFGTRCR